MPRFELAKSRELRFFWEVEVVEDPPAVRTCFGRVGDDGNETVRELPSVVAARKELTRLVGAKRAEGYVEVQYLPLRLARGRIAGGWNGFTLGVLRLAGHVWPLFYHSAGVAFTIGSITVGC